ncbi:MAG: pilus assembly protein PilM [Clostridia bacterium]|nr:pilus assembly protein PilM [Clostridia bacterium]
MVKTLLGIDIGYDSLKLALVTGKSVRKTAVVSMPVRLIKDGRVVSVETMGETIRDAVRDNGMRARGAAVALPGETVFIRNVTLPLMSEEQLRTNIPYEFRDYIPDELKNYVFDYETIENKPSEDGNPDEGKAIDLLAVAAPVAVMNETRDYLRKARMGLTTAAPAVCAFANLIRAKKPAPNAECCVLDLGNRAIRIHVFRGGNYVVTRVLETGLNMLDDVIADKFNVDTHLAHTYLITDYGGCQSCDECVAAYNSITVELMRAINFYRFSNQDSTLNDVYLCGGGAANTAFRHAIEASLMMNVHHASELVGGGDGIENCDTLIQAIGIAMS